MNMRHYLGWLLVTMVASTACGMDNALKVEMAKRDARKQKEAQEVQRQAAALEVTKELPFIELSPTEIVTRVSACNIRMQEDMTRLQPLLAQQTSLKIECEQRTAPLTDLLKKKSPLETEMQRLTGEKRKLVDQEKKVDFKKREIAIFRLIEASAEFAMHEPLLCHYPKEKFAPLLLSQLRAQKKDLLEEVGKVTVAWRALNKQIIPFTQEEKILVDAKQKTAGILITVEESIAAIMHAKSDAEQEKTQLLKAIEHKLATAIKEKQQLEDEVSAIRLTIAEEKDTNTKISLRTQLTTKVRAISELPQLISDLKIARAQADGTYSKLAWIAGHYK